MVIISRMIIFSLFFFTWEGPNFFFYVFLWDSQRDIKSERLLRIYFKENGYFGFRARYLVGNYLKGFISVFFLRGESSWLISKDSSLFSLIWKLQKVILNGNINFSLYVYVGRT